MCVRLYLRFCNCKDSSEYRVNRVRESRPESETCAEGMERGRVQRDTSRDTDCVGVFVFLLCDLQGVLLLLA